MKVFFAERNSVVRRIAGLVALAALYPTFLQPQTPTTEYIRAGGRVIATVKAQPAYFTDMTGSYAPFLGQANMMYATGITHGTAPNTFDPSATLTRDVAAVFIIRAIYVALLGPGQGDSFTYNTTSPFFTDVPTTYTYYKWIEKMGELGITSGCAMGPQYCPTTAVTNDAMAVFVIRARQYVLTGNALSSFYYPSSALFTGDVPVGATHFSFINAIGGLGVVVPATGSFGCSAFYFCPTSTLLRGPAAAYVVHGILNDWSY